MPPHASPERPMSVDGVDVDKGDESRPELRSRWGGSGDEACDDAPDAASVCAADAPARGSAVCVVTCNDRIERGPVS